MDTIVYVCVVFFVTWIVTVVVIVTNGLDISFTLSIIDLFHFYYSMDPSADVGTTGASATSGDAGSA